MKSLIKLVTAALALLSLSCQQKIENEEKFKGWFESARIYDYLGQEDKALDCLDSLQISVIEQTYKKLPKEKLLELSEINSRAWIERGKIYREMGDCEGALKCFRTAIITYYGYLEGFEGLSNLDCWDSIAESYIEKAKTLEKMGKNEEAKKLREVLDKYRRVNYSR